MSDGKQQMLNLPRAAHAKYDAYCDIRLAPVSASPNDDDNDSEGTAQQPTAADDDDGVAGDGQQPEAGNVHR